MAIRLKGTNIIFALVVILMLAVLFWPMNRSRPATKSSAPKVAATTDQPPCPELLAKRYKAIASSIKIDRVKADIVSLSSHPSRLVGYPGCEKASDYVEKQFRQIGLDDIKSEPFRVTVPIDEGSRIVVNGQSFQIHALWPNLVRTSHLPPQGLEVHVIDGGGGRLPDFDGKVAKDSAALVDFNSGTEWLNAPRLGARVLLFVEPDSTMRGEGESKFSAVPVSMPRFWVSKANAAKIRALIAQGKADHARVYCTMPWEKVRARNIVGVIRGTDPKLRNEWIVLHSYYDSTSVVPALAPGAESTCGISALFELARLYSKPEFAPKRSVMFVATSAHFQGLAGMREFVESHIDNYRLPRSLDRVHGYLNAHWPRSGQKAFPWPPVVLGVVLLWIVWMSIWGRMKSMHGRVPGIILVPVLLTLVAAGYSYSMGVNYAKGFDYFVPDPPHFYVWCGLDLSSQTPGVGLFYKGYFYDYREDIQGNFSDLASRTRENSERVASILGYYDERAARFADGVNPVSGKNWRNFVPGRFALDSEVVTLAGGKGVSFVSTDDGRQFVDTPFDKSERINYGNLGKQIEMLGCLIDHWFRDTNTALDEESIPAKVVDRRTVAIENPLQVGYVQGVYTNESGRGTCYFKPKTEKDIIPSVAQGIIRLNSDLPRGTKMVYVRHKPLTKLGMTEECQFTRMGLQGGFARLSGNVVQYDPRRSFVPNLRVGDCLAVVRSSNKSYMGVRANIIDRTTPDKGFFSIPGVAPLTAYGYQRMTSTGAYKLDSVNGDIICAPDQGAYGQFYPTSFPITTGYKDMPIIVFDCKATSIYDLVDPQSLRALGGLSIYEGDTNGAPRQYGSAVAVPEWQNPHIEDMAVIFTEDTKKSLSLATGASNELKRIRLKLVMSAGPAANRLLLLNSTLGNEVVPAKVVKQNGRAVSDKAVPADAKWQVKVQGVYLEKAGQGKNYYFLGPGETDMSITSGVIGLSREILDKLKTDATTVQVATNQSTTATAELIKVATLDKPWYEVVAGVYMDRAAKGRNYFRPVPNQQAAMSLKSNQVCVTNDLPSVREVFVKVKSTEDGSVRTIPATVDALDAKAVVLGPNPFQVRAEGVYLNEKLSGRNYYEPASPKDGTAALAADGPVLTTALPKTATSTLWIKTNQPQPIRARAVKSLLTDKPIEAFVEGVYADKACKGTNYCVSKFGASYNNASLLRGEIQLTSPLPDGTDQVYVKPFPQPEGIGYDVTDGGTIDETAFKVGNDMWKLDESRLGALAAKGVVNEGLTALHTTSRTYLDLAAKAKDSLNYSVFDSYCRAAWGYEARAYPDVTSSAQDVVNGVIFYLFLMLPFAYFCERLFFAFPTLGKQLLAFFGLFLLLFVIFYFVHPAFQIVGQSSLVILIAFVMLALSLLVISIITGKFEDQLKQLNQSVSGIHRADIGRMSVAAAAFSLGISNMRRRKERTILTCATLILLTFTVLSFTSIVSELRFNKVPSKRDSDTHVYDGIMIRTAMWDSLQEIAYRHLKDEFGNEGKRGKTYPVAPRAWFFGTIMGEQSFLTLRRGVDTYDAKAAIGMVPDEAEIMDLETKNKRVFLAGDWFGYKNGKRVPGPVDPYSIIIPDAIAEKLKITVADVGKAKVLFGGAQYTVIAILKNNEFKKVKDLDNEPLTPVDFIVMSKQGQQQQQGGEAGFKEYTHHEPANTFIVPYDTLMSLGGEVRSIAIKFASFDEVQKQLDGLMRRMGLNLYAGIGNSIYRYSSIAASSSKGFSNVFIPVLIAALIVLNTMLGSVFERVREIGIFSSIGLAPNHIAVLFIAESMVYANLGAVSGYVVGQAVSKLLMATHWLPGLYLNFSSMSAVTSTVIVVAVVLLSTLYPARKASEVATPSVDRSWKVPEPVGDDWDIVLPFAVTGAQAAGVNGFLAEWFQAYEEYSIGDFVTQDVGSRQFESEFGGAFEISCKAWLAPFDLGVSQKVILQTVPTSMEDVFEVKLRITRESGDISNWKRVNRRFLNTLRKQFLIWRTLRASDRERYLNPDAAGETGVGEAAATGETTAAPV